MVADDAPDKQDMILAFGYETAREIVHSDGSIHSAELLDVTKRFPREVMEGRGLIANGEPTGRFGQAYNLAVAKLRTIKTDSNLLLLHTEMGAGHGGKSGRYKRNRETAMSYAFLMDQLGVATN